MIIIANHGGAETGTYDGGGGGGATRHVVKIESGNKIATALFQGNRGVLQVGDMKKHDSTDESITYDCSVTSFSGKHKGATWKFTLTWDKKAKAYTLHGYNYSVALHKMTSEEEKAFWNSKGLLE